MRLLVDSVLAEIAVNLENSPLANRISEFRNLNPKRNHCVEFGGRIYGIDSMLYNLKLMKNSDSEGLLSDYLDYKKLTLTFSLLSFLFTEWYSGTDKLYSVNLTVASNQLKATALHLNLGLERSRSF